MYMKAYNSIFNEMHYNLLVCVLCVQNIYSVIQCILFVSMGNKDMKYLLLSNNI